MKRWALVFLFATSLSISLMAQEPAAQGSAAETQAAEPSMMWTWLNFALLAAGLGYLIAKTVPQAFRDRSAEIQKGITEAQAMKKDAERRAAEMDARLTTLGADIDAFRRQAHSEMEQEGARIRQETERQIAHLRDQAEQEIESAAKAARRDLKIYAADLALDLAEQRIKTRLDGSTEAGLVDDFVTNLGQQPGSKN